MFQFLIYLEPLGLLYGSSGRFLSPDNLVGRSGENFPPTATTASGLFAAHYPAADLQTLYLAGPFWSRYEDPQNIYVPKPMTVLTSRTAESVKNVETHHLSAKAAVEKLLWDPNLKIWRNAQGEMTSGKYDRSGWIPLSEWSNPTYCYENPWKFLPHLHPRLKQDERRVDTESDQGSLFLENAVQLNPDIGLVYLSSLPLPTGWYRFGGEGHMVNLQCWPLKGRIRDWLNQPLGRSFALLTPALWGSNRLSYRYPVSEKDNGWHPEALLTERPSPFRFRLGGKGLVKRLSRGRYAVPAGTVYVMDQELESWQEWPETWFPQEGYSFKRWGCGLALPLPDVIRQ